VGVELHRLAVDRNLHRGGMARAGNGHVGAVVVNGEHQIGHRDEAAVEVLTDEGIVEQPQDIGRIDDVCGQATQRPAGHRGQGSRLGPFAADVAQHQRPASRAQLEHVVEVPADQIADGAGGELSGELTARDRRYLLRQEALLERAGGAVAPRAGALTADHQPAENAADQEGQRGQEHQRHDRLGDRVVGRDMRRVLARNVACGELAGERSGLRADAVDEPLATQRGGE
jgi:hypothetical protein